MTLAGPHVQWVGSLDLSLVADSNKLEQFPLYVMYVSNARDHKFQDVISQLNQLAKRRHKVSTDIAKQVLLT